RCIWNFVLAYVRDAAESWRKKGLETQFGIAGDPDGRRLANGISCALLFDWDRSRRGRVASRFTFATAIRANLDNSTDGSIGDNFVYRATFRPGAVCHEHFFGLSAICLHHGFGGEK